MAKTKEKDSKKKENNTKPLVKEDEYSYSIAINKYSIFDLKAGMDTRIAEYLEESQFTEINYHTNLKIVVGLFCLFWTALAYLNGKEFPDNYYIILVSVIFYFIGSSIYWYIESYIVLNTFYIGDSQEYFQNNFKNSNIKYLKINSEIKDNDQYYICWLTVVTKNGNEIECTKFTKSFCDFYNERGYANKYKIDKFSDEMLNSVNDIVKSIN